MATRQPGITPKYGLFGYILGLKLYNGVTGPYAITVTGHCSDTAPVSIIQ